MKKCYAAKQMKGCKSFSFKIGDKVLLKNCRKISRNGSRMEHNWLGPATITSFKQNGAVVTRNGKVWRNAVALINMKPYIEKNQTLSSAIILNEHNYCLPMKIKMARNNKNIKEPIKSNKIHIVDSKCYVKDKKNKLIKVENSLSKNVYPAISFNNKFFLNLSTQSVKLGLDILKSPCGWLNDTLIDIAQSFLSSQFPHIAGFQSSCIFNKNNSGGYIHSGKFIQILNVRNSHWILIINVSSDTCLKSSV
nr:uncharacterized protein LOC124807387 [Hydra vulgaris]